MLQIVLVFALCLSAWPPHGLARADFANSFSKIYGEVERISEDGSLIIRGIEIGLWGIEVEERPLAYFLTGRTVSCQGEHPRREAVAGQPEDFRCWMIAINNAPNQVGYRSLNHFIAQSGLGRERCAETKNEFGTC